MIHNHDKRFDISLAEGEIMEKEIANILGGLKIEIKHDKMSQKTGNIAIEYESWGRPSGIAISDADYWCIALEDSDLLIFIKIDKLKELARKAYANGQITTGGDDNTSKLILIKKNEILQKT